MSRPHKIVRIALAFGLALVALDIGDNLVLRLRVARQMNPYGSVVVKRYLAIRQKSQKVEFVRLDPETRPCANTLLPQMGLSPCWYAARTTMERIDM
jgi:hypothetical protein